MENKKLLYVISILLVSCSPNKKESKYNSLIDTVSKNVSISHSKSEINYKLSMKVTNFVNDSIIGKRPVAYCYFDYNIENAQTSIGFKFGSDESIKSNRSKQLIHLSNRFLIIKEKKIPVLFPADDFADIPQDKKIYLDCFNFSTIKLDYKGRIIDFVNLRE